MALRHFTLEYWTDEGWYVGRLKEVPGIFSQGETLGELEDNIRDAYKLMVEDEIESLPVHIKIQTKEIGVKCFTMSFQRRLESRDSQTYVMST